MNPSPLLIACPGCDLLLHNTEIYAGKKACCPCCNTTLYQQKTDSISKVLAISISGLLAFIPAVFLPLMTLEAIGITQSASIFDAFLSFYHQRYYLVAVVVFLTSIFFPLFKLSLLFSIALQLKLRFYSPTLPYLLRTTHHLDEWAMPEIYLIGVFITIIKIINMASISFETGFFCFLFLVLTTIASTSALDYRTFWRELEQIKPPLQTDAPHD